MAEIEWTYPKLFPFQQEWFDGRKPITAIEGGSFTGKTTVFEPFLFQRAHEATHPGKEFWWVAPTTNQAKEVYSSIKRNLTIAGVLGKSYKHNDTDRTITVPGGGIWVGKTAEEPDNLFGNRQVEEIVGDEFTRWRFSVLKALVSIAAKNSAWMTLIGNFQGDTTAWHTWINSMIGDPDFAYFRTPTTRAVEEGLMPRKLFERAQRTLTPPEFAAQYLCEGADDKSSLVEYAAVGDIWTNDHVPEGPPALTCDIALQGSDRFVMQRWSGWRLKEIEVFEKMEATKVVDIIKGKATAYSIPRSSIVYDGDGVGMFLNSYLEGASEYRGGTTYLPQNGQVQTFQNLRAQTHFGTATRINQRGILIEDTRLRHQMEQEIFACLRTNGQDASGRWGIWPKDHATEGAKMRLQRSPDLFDPIPMRMFLDLTPAPIFAAGLAHTAQRKRVSFRSSSKHEGNTNIEGR